MALWAEIGDYALWTVKNGKLEKVAALDYSPIGLDIDETTGTAHILLQSGEIKRIPLPKQPAFNPELPKESQPADAGLELE